MENVTEKEKRVKLFVPRGASNDDPNLFISVNGVNYLLPRGKESHVPDFVAAEYNRSMRAEQTEGSSKDRLMAK